MVLQGIIASDDEEVEAWYLEGWCFFLMSEHAREQGGKLDELTWEELARDSRDYLETCKMVCFTSSCLTFPQSSNPHYSFMLIRNILIFLYVSMSKSSYQS